MCIKTWLFYEINILKIFFVVADNIINDIITALDYCILLISTGKSFGEPRTK